MICQVITLVLIATSNVHCYENAYDLAEKRMLHRSSVFGQPGFLNRDEGRSYARRPVHTFGTRLRRPEYEPMFGRHSAGNGYDNLGNGGTTRQGGWAEFLEPSRPFNAPRWNRYFDDSNVRSSGQFYEEEIPFQRKDSGFLSRADTHFNRRDFDVEEPFEEKYSARRTLFEKDALGRGKARPSQVFSETPLRRHPFRRPDTSKLLPRPHQRVAPLPTTRTALRHQPAFYNKNFFGRRSAPHEAGGTSVESEDVLEDVQSAAGAADDSVITEGGSYFSNNEDKEEQKSDAAYHNDKKGAVVDVANKQKVGEATRFDKNGGNKSTIRVNKTAKKGHTTKGFATHHHKDETGNTTTFFDESADTGGQEDYQDHEDEFGARRTMEVLNGREDGQFFKEHGGRIGRFGSGVLQDKTKFEKDAVAKSNRFNQEESFGKGKDQHDKRTKLETDYLGGGTWGESY